MGSKGEKLHLHAVEPSVVHLQGERSNGVVSPGCVGAVEGEEKWRERGNTSVPLCLVGGVKGLWVRMWMC